MPPCNPKIKKKEKKREDLMIKCKSLIFYTDIFCSVEAGRNSLEKHIGWTNVGKNFFPTSPSFQCNNLSKQFIAAYAAA